MGTLRAQADMIEYTNATGVAISAGHVVQLGDKSCGIAAVDIAIAGVGNVFVGGIHRIAKAAEAIAVYNLLYWDFSAKVMTDTVVSDTGDIADVGIAVTAAASGDTYVDMWLNAQIGATGY